MQNQNNSSYFLGLQLVGSIICGMLGLFLQVTLIGQANRNSRHLGIFFKSIFTILGISLIGGIITSSFFSTKDFGYGFLTGTVISAFFLQN